MRNTVYWRVLGKAAVLALLLLAPGCVASRTYFEPISELTDPTQDALTLERPVKLLVAPYMGPARHLHKALVTRLLTNPTFEVVKYVSPIVAEADFDYLVDFDMAVEGDGTAGNFFRCFPGFVILAPQWYPLTWNCVLESEVRVTRISDRKRVSFARKDGVEMEYTSVGYSTAAHAGWWSLLFSPMGAFPLGTGIVAVFDDVDTPVFYENLPRSDTGVAWTKTIVQELTTRIAELERAETNVSE